MVVAINIYHTRSLKIFLYLVKNVTCEYFYEKIRVVLVYLYESSMPGLKEKYLILISAAGSSLW